MVLNQNYEPLTICNVRRAVVLIYLGKAEAIYCIAEKKVRSIKRSFEYPSIVRLIFFVRVPFKKIILSRKNILRRDNHKCQYCGAATNLTVDHVMPKSRNGEDSWENLTTACSGNSTSYDSRTENWCYSAGARESGFQPAEPGSQPVATHIKYGRFILVNPYPILLGSIHAIY